MRMTKAKYAASRRKANAQRQARERAERIRERQAVATALRQIREAVRYV